MAPKREARFAPIHAEPGFTTNLPLGALDQDDVLFASGYDGKDLTPGHGRRLRRVVPGGGALVNGRPASERVRELLLEQIAALGELRNSTTRDTRFRAWRQNTLTLIQRLWPDDPVRSERFRRIPFTAPSNKMNTRTWREFYERGCAEAALYLKSMITEVEQDQAPAGPEPAAESEGDGAAVLPGATAWEGAVAGSAAPEDAPAEPPPVAAPVDPPAPADWREALIDGLEALLPKMGAAPAQPPAGSVGPAEECAEWTAYSSDALPLVPDPPVAPVRLVAEASETPDHARASQEGGTKSAPSGTPVATSETSRTARPRTPRPARGGKKSTPKRHLKDMLGLGDLPQRWEPDAGLPPPHSPLLAPTTLHGEDAMAPAPPAAEPCGAVVPETRAVDEIPSAARPSTIDAEAPGAEPGLGAEPVTAGIPPRKAEVASTDEPPARTAPLEPLEDMAAPGWTPSPLEFIAAPMPEDEAAACAPANVDPAAAEPSAGDSAVAPAATAGITPALAPLPAPAATEPADAPAVAEPSAGDSTVAPAATAEITPALAPLPAPAATEPADAPAVAVPTSLTVVPEPTEPEPLDLEQAAEEFFRTCAVFNAAARPVCRADTKRSAPALSAAGAALVALAADVPNLGVPEGHRAGMRAVLLDLARQLDSPSLNWGTLREAMHIVIEYPPLARRLLPVLLPYIDRAA